MRIRRSAARLLGSAYSAPAAPPPDAAAPSELLTPPPPPPSYPEPCSALESRAVGGLTSQDSASGEACELSRSPWDLIAELSISDPQVEDDLVDKFFVSVTCRPSWLFTSSDMPVASIKKEKHAMGAVDTTSSQPRQKKAPNKLAAVSKENESEPKKKAKVKKEEDQDQEVKQPTYKYKCKKNDGKRWHCRRLVSSPNSLCDYHFYQKRAYLNPEFTALVAAEAEVEAETEVPQPAPASKPATSSKPRKKKPRHDFGASEGFYYYAGFGPCRSKRHCRSNDSMNEYVPPMEKEEEPAEDGSPTNEQAQAAADDTIQQLAAGRDGKSSSDVVIAGVDEESSDDHYELGSFGRHMNGSGEHRFGNSDGKRSKGWKRQRKPVKARSLKSLM